MGKSSSGLRHPANVPSPRAPAVPDVYEEYQGWPPEVTEGVARYFLSAIEGGPARCLVLGAATGVNDALPLARDAGPSARILAGDIEPAFLGRLQERAVSEGLSNLETCVLDITADLSSLGSFDLVSLLFVIHRLNAWEEVLDRLCQRVAPGGSFFISEFVGPEGVIYLSNEAGGKATDPVSRMIRRYFELLPEPFAPSLRSTDIRPVLQRLSGALHPEGHRDFNWGQSIMPGEMYRRIRDKAYAPYFSTHASAGALDQLRQEFAGEWSDTVRQTEVIRIHRFRRRE